MDWYSWHDGYDGPSGGRLQVVQTQIDAALATMTESPIRVISICAGQGHDIVGSLQRFDRRRDVEALLVELDERNVEAARRRIADASLTGIRLKAADAGVTDVYKGMVPADLILACGVFGSLTDQDIDRTVGLLPTLSSPNAQVVWTANRAAPGLWDTALTAFDRHGFREVWTTDRAEERFGIGRHRLTTQPRPFEPGMQMFSFADEDTLVRIGRIST
ncbi:class I SAM-dependent methyltransferase family protein [Actinopolymorpha alba]|uniref:class I SAM-dependent methyltransferase family protein n=1 Tax=Actinopolymorpha alba TaxID=533267 RepID=UPI000374ED56|nr:class I SAM-dependent methyltransferase family protein [Actinopolymorpha alba]